MNRTIRLRRAVLATTEASAPHQQPTTNPPPRLRRVVAAAAGAVLLAVGLAGAAASASAAGGDDDRNGAPLVPDKAAVSANFPPGSELQFVSVAPCRILDTRVAGGKLVNTSRVFDATLASYAGQGGKAGSCGIPEAAVSVQLNVGAISQDGSTAHVTVWATGTPEPLASLINYNPSGPVANMATVPINASGQFTAKTPGSVHLFADVAGYYVKPLYVMVNPSGAIYEGKASGVVSITHVSTGRYDVRFNRDVQRCSAQGSNLTWASNYDVSPDNQDFRQPETVSVGIVDPGGTFQDAYFYLDLRC